MAKEDDYPVTPLASNPSPNPRNEALIVSQASSSHPLDTNNNIAAGDTTPSSKKQNSGLNTPSPKKTLNPEEFILSVASKIASQPLQYSDPDVWGVLTAISESSRKRRQGMNMLLTREEHRIGRVVEDVRFQILSNQISGNHCKIYRKKVPIEENVEHPSKFNTYVFLKDTSTNGTYLNWEKLTKHSPESKLHHGDIISFAAPPQHELAYAFVFREVLVSTSLPDGLSLKRKSEDVVYDSKRLRGIGIGASEGPLSLDDFRSLQRSNTELRKQLESHVTTIESLRSENRATVERHEIEKKEIKESVSNSYSDRLENLNNLVESKQKELAEVTRNLAEQKHALEDLDERLGASVQSCTEANEIINSQKASISEFKALLDEERDQRREEREKAESDLKASIQRVQSEAQEEFKRLSETALKREKEQQEIINKLQESEKERCSLVEILRSKLEETRKKSVISDNKVRQLEAQICEEQQASANARKKIEELENEVRRLKKELEREKAAREEAWAKVSVLELEINAAKRDLDFEKRKLRGARERIILRETQLRAFYSTTEEISVLFVKQQEQLKSMQRTLEDEENYDNISFDIDLNPNGNINKSTSLLGRKEVLLAEKAESGNSTRRHTENRDESSTSDTEKHDCNTINQDDNNNHVEETQEADFTSGVRNVANGAFGSDIDGVSTEPIGTERVYETETLPEDGEMVARMTNPVDTQNATEDDDNGTVRTGDLLASEVAGSWACSTAPSVQGDNDSVRCEERYNNDVVAESESVAASDDDRKVMRTIFGDGGGSDTEDCSDDSEGTEDGEIVRKSDNAIMDIDDDDDEATQADSVG